MQTLGERLAKRREQLGLSQKALSQKVGVSQQSINKIESGQTRSPRNLERLAIALSVTSQWLLFGDTNSPTTLPKLDEIKESRLRVKEWESMDQEQKEFVDIPVLNVEASAGSGAMLEEEREIYRLPFRRYTLRRLGVNPRDARIVSVIGNSMAPLLRTGDVVGIDTANQFPIIDGDYYAIRDGDLIRVKQLVAKSDGGITIKSFNNTEYPDESLNRQEFQQRIHIIGRVFWSSSIW